MKVDLPIKSSIRLTLDDGNKGDSSNNSKQDNWGSRLIRLRHKRSLNSSKPTSSL